MQAKNYLTKDKIYCYSESEVLKNKLNLRNDKDLERAERFITGQRQMDLEIYPINGNFDFEHLKLIHKKLFDDLYEFAGKIRKVDIEKGKSKFCVSKYIQKEGEKLFKNLKAEDYFQNLDKNNLVIKLAEFIGELIALHPFREGNGRSIREFIRNLCYKRGYDFNFQKIDPSKRVEAEILAFNCKYEKLIEILKKELILLEE